MFSLGAHETRSILDWTAALLAVAVTLSTLEDLARYAVFRDDGLMSWKVARLGRRGTAHGAWSAIADAFLAFPRYRWLLIARLGMTAAVFIAPPALRATLFFMVAASLAADLVRCPFGHSGAHQMMICVSAALGFGYAAPDGHVVAHISLWFIALQVVVAYVTSGWAKLLSAPWRSGRALTGIMGTAIYGHPRVHALLARRPRVAWLASWATILFESSFFIVLITGRFEVTAGFLAVSGLFHLTVAMVMGLNLFFWSFVATYPALLFCTSAIVNAGGLALG
jgi:hypothetical protein